ncbi:DEAD/DEAH box helicase [Gracilibacillus sp. YIM 98692]|uniref:DEAD/DEAH box helicase n=1 Tax=Gracilibacillus sp. YIM 98692 TaxID=2663532 RepID=UPI0013D1FF71|nr:DEAD/DEAH box helicase [Gracilibacillus sp. YIM 98692]
MPNYPQLLAGKQLLLDELPLTEAEISTLQETNQLQFKEAISKKTFHYQCKRCGNTKQHLFATIPCARCNQTHHYCRNCITTGRVLFCETLSVWIGQAPDWPHQEQPCHWEGTLTKAQRQAAEKLQAVVRAANQEILCWAVCGAGKTEMLFPAITTAIHEQMRICLATPRADVVRELYPRLKQAFPHTEIEALYGGTEDATGIGQLVIATTHQLIRYSEAFDVMIIDEIDAFPYHHDKTLHYFAHKAAKKDAANIYLTATPRPKERRKIEMNKLPAVFVPIRFHGHPLPVPKLMLEWNLRRKLQNAQLPKKLKRYVETRTIYRQLLIFVSTINLLEPVASCCRVFFPKLETVYAEDPDRKEKVEAFRAKEYDLLITTTILERGVTFPSIDVVILDAGHTVFDEAALVQIAGRAGRSPKDPTGDVLFIHQGKTEAMVQAIRQINQMNKKGRE